MVAETRLGLAMTGRGFMRRLPLGRFGLPEEVSGIALFLVSDLTSYVRFARRLSAKR